MTKHDKIVYQYYVDVAHDLQRYAYTHRRLRDESRDMIECAKRNIERARHIRLNARTYNNVEQRT